MAKELDSLERKAYEAYSPRITGALGETIDLMLELNDGMPKEEASVFGDISDKLFCFATIPVRENLFAQIVKEKDDFNNINPNKELLTTFTRYIELKMPAKKFEENDDLSALYEIYKNIKSVSSRLKVIKTIEEVCQKKDIVNYDDPDLETKKRLETILEGDPSKLLREKKVLEKEIEKMEKKFAIKQAKEQKGFDELKKEVKTYVKEVGEAYLLEADLIEQPDQLQVVIDAYTEHMEDISGTKKEIDATHDFVETKLAGFFPYFTRAMTKKDTRDFFKKNKISIGTAVTKWGGIFGYSLTDAKRLESGKNAPSKTDVLRKLTKLFTSKGGKVKKKPKKKPEKAEIIKQAKTIADLPEGIASWADFLKDPAIKGLPMGKKSSLWKQYKEPQPVSTVVTGEDIQAKASYDLPTKTTSIAVTDEDPDKIQIIAQSIPTKAEKVIVEEIPDSGVTAIKIEGKQEGATIVSDLPKPKKKKKRYQVQIKPKGRKDWRDMGTFDKKGIAKKHADNLARGSIGAQTRVVDV